MPRPPLRNRRRVAALVPAAAALIALVAQSPALASRGPGARSGHQQQTFSRHTPLIPGNVLVATSLYADDPNVVAGTTQLPPGCGSATDPCGTAVADGEYPYVFNNDAADASFGITSKIVLDELTPRGDPIGTIEVPNSSEARVGAGDDQMVTSFSSKSELALNLSTDGRSVTFMGYNPPRRRPTSRPRTHPVTSTPATR